MILAINQFSSVHMLLLLLVLTCRVSHAVTAAPELSLWPMPTAATLQSTTCLAIDQGTFTFTSSSKSPILGNAMARYTNLTFLSGAPVQPCTPMAEGSDVAVHALVITVLSADEMLGPTTNESYTLIVNESGSATLSAASVYGALRGLETFAQLTFGGSGTTRHLPAVNVQDAPRFGYRAIMVDTARLFRPVALLEQMMDAMASTKFNTLYLHLTDNGCWPLEILAYPLLTTNCTKGCNLDGSSATSGKFYSQAEIRALVVFARDRGIRVIPEIDSPGHFDTGACYPELLTLADYPCPGAGPGTGHFRGPPDPSNPDLWTFFAKVYAEMASLFPDPYVSLGGDEAWLTPWSCSPPVEKWMATNKLQSLDAAAQWWVIRSLPPCLAVHTRACVGLRVSIILFDYW
jgi:hexosaminidase